MNQAQTILESRLRAGFAIFVIALLLLTGLTWRFSLRAVDATGFVLHTHEVIAGITRLQMQLYHAESEQRAYLISGEAVFLKDYHEARHDITASLAQLNNLLTHNPLQSMRIVDLSRAIDARIDIFERYINLRENKDLPAITNGMFEGHVADQRIGSMIDIINDEEHRLLLNRQEIEAQRAAQTALGFAGLVGLFGLSIPLIYVRLRRNLKEKEAASMQTRRLIAVIDSTPDLIAMSSAQGKISYLNRAARKIFDLGERPVSEMTEGGMYPSWAQDIVTRIGIPSALAHGTWSGETALLCADGREIPVSQVLIAHRQADGTMSLSTIARNISERKESEKLLAEAARYHLTISTALALFNAEPHRQKILQGCFALLAANHGFPVAAFYAWHEASGSLQLNQSSGISEDAKPLFKPGEGMVGTAGLTRKIMHIKLNESDSQFVARRTDPNHTAPAALLFCPIAFHAELLGVLVLASQIEPTAQDLAFIENLSAHLAAALYNIKQLEELKILTKELREKSEEVALKNVQLEQASRLKNEFLATMSHELRTPLNAIIGFSSAIRDGLSGEVNSSTQSCAQDILSSGQHLLALINDILDLSTIESGHMKLETNIVDGHTLASSGLSIIREQAEKKQVTLIHQVSSELSGIYLDARKTRQIIFNLLSNAVKFTPQGGQVELSLELASRSQIESRQHSLHQRLFPLPPSEFQSFLEIKVRDTGLGISAQDLEKLFEPFVQIDSSHSRQYEGTGLGLVMVRRLTELQSGAVHIQSMPCKGSCFTVWLPLREAVRALPGPAAMPELLAP